MKKIAAVLLALCCMALVFAGCSNTAGKSVSTDGSTSMEKVIRALGYKRQP